MKGRSGQIPADLHMLSKVLMQIQQIPEFSTQARNQAAIWRFCKYN